MRLLIVEDDKIIADFIKKGMQENGFLVDVENNSPDGLAKASTEDYDAAVVDIMLPGMDGLTVIEKIRQRGINFPVLILSAKQSVDDRITGLQKGGDDYLIKPFSFSELLVRIQALIRRDKKHSQPTVLEVGELRMELLRHEVRRGQEKLELPAKEYALLEYMMRNPEIVLSKTAILERVYEYSFDPQTNVVDVLVCRLRNKVDKGFDRKMIHTVRGMGYVLKP
ncbi:MAG: DNA-binding response regulator [Deltaproteobacteria bacterium]|nr:MAG: DNA-binding response regulator [Deltaproteobacteria bacterium]